MSGLKEIKKRITSVKNTQQITKAMKMVAASKLRRVQSGLDASQRYAAHLSAVIAQATTHADSDYVPLLKKRTRGNAGILLITSDKGLCGGLNANLSKKLLAFYEQEKDNYDKIFLYCVGRKGRDFFVRRSFDIKEQFVDQKDIQRINSSAQLTERVIDLYAQEELNAFYIAYTSFKSVITHVPSVRQILPVSADNTEETSEIPDIIFEPADKTEILNTILPRYVSNAVYTALLESTASEHGARMAAMDAATRNAGEMIARLRLYYNRARQAAITTELTEIISGAETIR